MSTFSLPITPPDPSQAGFTVEHMHLRYRFATRAQSLLRALSTGGITNAVLLHGTLRYRARLAPHTLSFGSWLEPRYIFAARQLV